MLTQFIIKGECSCIKVNLAGRATLSPVRRDNNCSAPFSRRRRKSETRKTESEIVLALKSELNFKTGKIGKRLRDLQRDNNCSAPFSQRRKNSDKRKTRRQK